MNHGSLFSGIGGFDLAAQWMGWENKFHCEWNPFGQKVLKHYWPNAASYNDITKSDFTIHRGQIDILTGGFPCQPYSTAGKRLGKEDDRHLWPEMLRAIREIQPTWIVGENVRGLVNWNGGLVFDEVQSEMESEGYEDAAFLLPACAVNARHRRDRVWFVAHAINGGSQNGRPESTEGLPGSLREGNANSNNFPKIEKSNSIPGWDSFPTQPLSCLGDDGLSSKLDGITFSKWRKESIKAAGNAIVPQVAYQIFQAIRQYELLQSQLVLN
ncbi:DNA cytosine methyltransferase [Pedobacter sp.]|uniref:DNA cytosine methyltransferase n=1 Tax=Pedobacter sp. TaxID=1411316 RepID=UPI003C4D242A